MIFKKSAMYIFIALAVISCSRLASTTLRVDELQDLFASKFCIEGVFVSMPAGPTIITASTTEQIDIKPLSDVSATELEQLNLQNVLQSTQNSIYPSSPANAKQKTAKSLIEELARYNNIQHQYQVTNEQGPAHSKRFTLTLKLGNELYEAEEASIKKAQHSAAAEALIKTKFQHPPQSTGKHGNSDVLTPTVELNTLAKKHGEPVMYMLEGQQGNNNDALHNHNIWGEDYFEQYAYKQHKQHNYTYEPLHGHGHAEVVNVVLRVGSREYSGEGQTEETAKRDAASKALHEFKQLPLHDKMQINTLHQFKQLPLHDNMQINTNSKSTLINTNENNAQYSIPDFNTKQKSSISLVHEIAVKQNLDVNFELISEEGPPHMKLFVTECRVGNLVAEGEGNRKKISKQNAAKNMLEKLRQLPLNQPTRGKRETITNTKYSSKHAFKNNGIPDLNTKQKSHVSHVYEIALKRNLNVMFEIVSEEGQSHMKYFVTECRVGNVIARGEGNSKKSSKQDAAKNILGKLTKVPNAPVREKISRKLKRKRRATKNKLRKLIKVGKNIIGSAYGEDINPLSRLMDIQQAININMQQIPTFVKEFLNGGTFPNGDVLSTKSDAKLPLKANNKQPTTQDICFKDQLLSVAKLMDVQVQFSDFLKANQDIMSLVSLSTTPPQVCYGEGPTSKASREKAALEALAVISKHGLDNVISKEKPTTNGLHDSQNPVINSGVITNAVEK